MPRVVIAAVILVHQFVIEAKVLQNLKWNFDENIDQELNTKLKITSVSISYLSQSMEIP